MNKTITVANVDPLVRVTSTGFEGDPRRAQLIALFDRLDERGKTTTLAMLAVAVKLHPKGA